MATVLFVIVLGATIAGLAFGAYSLRTLVGRWDRPKRGILDPIPRFPAPKLPAPAPIHHAPLQRVAQAPVVMPVTEAPPLPAFAIGTPAPVMAKPVIHAAVPGTLSTYTTKHEPPQRAAKGSVPPPLPAHARPIAPRQPRQPSPRPAPPPVRAHTPSVIVDEFAEEEMTSPDGPGYFSN